MLVRSPATPRIPGVLFAEDFGEEDEESLEAPVLHRIDAASDAPSESPTIAPAAPTAEEIEEGRIRAREEGFEAGLQAAQCDIAARRALTLERLDEALKLAVSDMHAKVSSSLDLVAGTFLSGLIECLPALCERHGLAEMTELVRAMLPRLEDDIELVVTVHPGAESSLREELKAMDLKARQITVIASERLLIGDITLTWDNGSASRDVSRWQTDMISRLMELDGVKGMRRQV